MLEVHIIVGSTHTCWKYTYMLEVNIHVGSTHICWKYTYMLEAHIHVGSIHTCWKYTYTQINGTSAPVREITDERNFVNV